MDFAAFLQLVHDQLKLDYEIIHQPSWARIKTRPYRVGDPDAISYSIQAHDQGTSVDDEAIKGFLGRFNLTEQTFRDAYNDYYEARAQERAARVLRFPVQPWDGKERRVANLPFDGHDKRKTSQPGIS